MSTPEKRPSSSPARRAEVRSRALAALEGFLRAGTRYPDVSVEAIAKRAGISRSTFYLYFRDKTELLVDATDWLKDLVFEVRLDRGADGSLGDLPGYVSSVERVIGRYREHSALLGAVNHEAEFDERVGATWSGAQRRYISWVAGILREEQARGLTAGSFDPELAASILVTGGEQVIAKHIARTAASEDTQLAQELGASQWFGFFRRPN
ncbi:TetR/AcrR family transcriptional regulator [Herbiconiux sp. CPCC 205763]|uniref:TetR/AcrR family transcriptional regulator n=1 Tax=Herbiconiux aconitum TaxID=2970913 RepID=A0ABT2GT07_9MICO|nr:TetR/AcrR family transcriptional regulator [Herbiconiux aconitum]MCS5719353.1 TetR/AcrR family transcriptional regulator [Herbiconiux aconitum]